MAKRQAIQSGAAFGEWTLTEKLDQGGNGDVWSALNAQGEPVAIKFLRRMEAEPYERFRNEVEVLERYQGMPGILSVLHHSLPDREKKLVPWYVMPLAVPSMQFTARMSPEQIVDAFLHVSDALENLHKDGVAHRDIKPANILALNGRLCLADFGLVKYPGRPVLTPDRRDVGPKFTMAPEMRRHANKADGLPADVFSLAKSLWIALTRNELGFDGQYTQDSSLSLSNFHPDLYTTPLDRLLSECTNDDPTRRPTIWDIGARLREWLAIVSDFHLQNAKQWEELLLRLFPHGAPKAAAWTDLDSIVRVINEVARVRALNHMFYPGGGGNTVTRAGPAGEAGFIELLDPEPLLLKPKKLTFESFGRAAEWNYLRLEADHVQPTGKYKVKREDFLEYLTELEPGRYAHPDVWEYRHDYEDRPPLPATARGVVRYLKGTFVFFSTSSPYNQDTDTYDARHEVMGEEAFRNYIGRNAEAFAAREARSPRRKSTKAR